MSKMVTFVAAVCAAAFIPFAQAAEVAGGNLKFTIGASLISNSNVVDPSGTSVSGQSDLAGAAKLGAKFKRRVGQSGRLSVSYNFTGTQYSDISSRDNVLQVGSVTYSQRINHVTVGGNYSYADYHLDGNNFMTLQRATAFLGAKGPFSSIVVASVANTQKDFAGTLTNRNAEANSLSLSATRKFGKGKLKLSYELADENANAAELDFLGNTFKATYTRKTQLGDLPIFMKAGVRYSINDYDNTNFLIGSARSDKRSQLEFGLEHRTKSAFTYGVKASYQDNSSNLPSADYNKTQVELSVSKTF